MNMTGTVLVASKNGDDSKFASRIACCCHADFLEVPEPGELVSAIEKSGPAALFLEISSMAEMEQYEKLLMHRIQPKRVHAIISPEFLKQIEFVLQSPISGNLIIRRFSDPDEAGRHYSRVVRATFEDTFFGLASLSMPEAETQTMVFEETRQWKAAVNDLTSNLLKLDFQERIAHTVANAVDELITNAIFDAPIDERGNPVFDTLPRSASLQLKGKHKIQMSLGVDGPYLGIAVTDLMGSLRKEMVFRYLAKSHNGKQNEAEPETKVSSGLGLAMILRSGGSILFRTKRGEKTEVTVIFRKTESYREFLNQFQFVSTRVYDPESDPL